MLFEDKFIEGERQVYRRRNNYKPESSWSLSKLSSILLRDSAMKQPQMIIIQPITRLVVMSPRPYFVHAVKDNNFQNNAVNLIKGHKVRTS